MKLKVIIADDHELFRQGFESLLLSIKEIGEIKHATNGKEALKLLEEEPADIIFMDISMPELNGIEATKEIKKNYPAVKIIALTMMDDHGSIVKMFKSGADGYLLKNINFKEVEMSVKQVMAGKKYYSRDVAEVLLEKIIDLKPVKRNGPVNTSLTEREKEIVILICKDFTSKEIGESLNIAAKTVESHRVNIYSKLHIDSVVDLVMYALDNGIVSRPGTLG